MTTPGQTPRNPIWKVLLPVLVIIALVTAGLIAVRSQVEGPDEAHAELAVGAQLPDFSLQQHGRGPVKLSEVKAKVILINFWATWCEACMVEMPSISKLRESYHARGLEVFGVNVDEDPDAAIPRTASELSLNFPMATDQDGKLSDLFDVQAIPLTVILDENRNILFIEAGERDWNAADVRAQMEEWLKG